MNPALIVAFVASFMTVLAEDRMGYGHSMMGGIHGLYPGLGGSHSMMSHGLLSTLMSGMSGMHGYGHHGYGHHGYGHHVAKIGSPPMFTPIYGGHKKSSMSHSIPYSPLYAVLSGHHGYGGMSGSYGGMHGMSGMHGLYGGMHGLGGMHGMYGR